MAPLIGLALSAVPSLIKLFESDDESTVSKVGNVVAKVAEGITGETEADKAANILKESPEAFIKFQQQLQANTVELYSQETERLKTVNQTIQQEIQSKDPYVRRMRPTFGYLVAVSWFLQMVAVVYAIIATPTVAPAIISALIGMTGLWTVALAVLGVYVYKRSEDKAIGSPQVGALTTLAKGIAKRIGG